MVNDDRAQQEDAPERKSKNDFPTPILVVVFYIFGLLSVIYGAGTLGGALTQPKGQVLGTVIEGLAGMGSGLLLFGIAQTLAYLRDIRGYLKQIRDRGEPDAR